MSQVAYTEPKHNNILDDIPEAYLHKIQGLPGPGSTALEKGAWHAQRLSKFRTLASDISDMQDAKQDVRPLAMRVATIKRDILNQQEPMVQLQHVR